MSSSTKMEARLLAAIAESKSLDEQARLMERLEEHRASVRQSRKEERELDLGAQITEPAFTAVRTFERNTHETDWLAQTAAGTEVDEQAARRKARAEAMMWKPTVAGLRQIDEGEYREQAKGKARHVASSFGPHREAAIEEFLKAAGVAKQGVMVDGEEYDYNGYVIEVNEHVDPEFDGDGYWAVVKGPGGVGDFDIVHETDEAEYPEDARADAEDWIDSKTGSRQAAKGQTCSVCGDKIAKDPDSENPSTWHHDNGEKHDHEAKPSEAKESRLREGTYYPANPGDWSDADWAMYEMEEAASDPDMPECDRCGFQTYDLLPSMSKKGQYICMGCAKREDKEMRGWASKRESNVDRNARMKHLLAADFPQRDGPSDDLVPGTMPSSNPDGPPESDEDADQSGHAQSGEGESPHVDPLDDNRGNRPAFPEQFDGGAEQTVNEVTSRQRRDAGKDVEVPGPPRTCDICQEREAKFDGKTVMGPWANMCSICFGQYGVGLGTGKGQKLIYTSRRRPQGRRRRTAGHWKVKVETEDGTKTVTVDLPEDAPIIDVDDEAWDKVDNPVETLSHDYVKESRRRQAMPSSDGWVQRLIDALPEYDLQPVNVSSYGGHNTYALEDGYDNPKAYFSVGPDYYEVEGVEPSVPSPAAQMPAGFVTSDFEQAIEHLRRILASTAKAGSRKRAESYATQECPRCGKTNAASANRCGKGGSGGCGAVLPTDEKWGSRRAQRRTARALYQIAEDIESEWGNVNYAARPYLDAMHNLDSINDKFFADDASSIVAYFLSNARAFRGERAKELKDELKALLGR